MVWLEVRALDLRRRHGQAGRPHSQRVTVQALASQENDALNNNNKRDGLLKTNTTSLAAGRKRLGGAFPKHHESACPNGFRKRAHGRAASAFRRHQELVTYVQR